MAHPQWLVQKKVLPLWQRKKMKRLYSHCFLHRENLVAKTIGNELKEVMGQVVQMVNYVKRRPLQSRLLAKISEEMGEKFKNVLLDTEVRWLSRGRVLCRVYELREMMLQLFRENTYAQ